MEWENIAFDGRGGPYILFNYEIGGNVDPFYLDFLFVKAPGVPK